MQNSAISNCSPKFVQGNYFTNVYSFKPVSEDGVPRESEIGQMIHQGQEASRRENQNQGGLEFVDRSGKLRAGRDRKSVV